MTLQIQAGKNYEYNNGLVTGPMRMMRPDVTYKWVDSHGSYFADDGSCYLHETLFLVREVPAPQPHSPLIFGAAMVGNEPVPVEKRKLREYWELVDKYGNSLSFYVCKPEGYEYNGADILGRRIVHMREVES